MQAFGCPGKGCACKTSEEGSYSVNKQTGERINDPALDVLRDKIVVSHDLNTVLVSLANKKRLVALTARPVKDDKNEMIGVSIQIREKTLTEIKMAEKIDTITDMKEIIKIMDYFISDFFLKSALENRSINPSLCSLAGLLPYKRRR